jgi:hypothetical protein
MNDLFYFSGRPVITAMLADLAAEFGYPTLDSYDPPHILAIMRASPYTPSLDITLG